MISFDQYQRYATIGKLVSGIQQKYKESKRYKVLEVGSNEQCNLEKFVDAEIFYTDIVEMEGFADNDHFFVADATNLEGIEDDAFDFVIASDVFEHIPSDLREAFLSELSRVSKECAIICFPFYSKSVQEAEERVNQYYKSIYGEDYIWLQEHIENGLPDLKKVNDFLDRQGIYYSVCQHGTIKIWEEMMKAHFYATGIPELVNYREYIDRYYSDNVYKYDTSDNNYRVFYLLSKKNRDLEEILSDLFQQDEIIQIQGFERIKTLCQDLHDMSVARLQNESYQKKFSFPPAKCYFNTGSGYDEDHTREYTCVSVDCENVYEIDELIGKKIKDLRFDVTEQYLCEIFDLKIWSDTGEKLDFYTNALCLEDSLLFKTRDPQIIVPVPDNVDKIVFSFHVSIMSDPMQERLFLLKYEAFIHMTEDKKNLENMYDELEKNYNQAQHNYDLIAASRFWRMTKPLRWLSAQLKKIKFIRYTAKIFLTCKREGVNKTIKYIRQSLTRKKNLLQYNNKEIAVDEVEENILFSILVPLYNTDLGCLKQLLDSIIGQTYSKWELCLGDASTENLDAIKSLCMDYQTRDERIRYFRIEHNNGIADNTNECAKRASGKYLVLCDHDDILAANALQANAWMIQQTNADVLYSDEDHIDITGKRHIVPLYKPDWSPDLLCSQMYICHLLVFKKELFESIGGFRSEYDGSQDYDLMLRFSERTNRIAHIPMILYSWREIETSTAVNVTAKPYANEAGRKALDAHLKRIYGKNAYAIGGGFPFVYEANYGLAKEQEPLVSIIIPMKDQFELSKQCVDSIIEKTKYTNYEILILNNCSEKEKTYQWFNGIQKLDSKIKVLDAIFEFNWSKLNNFGMKNANGDVYVFLNNDTLVISEDWLDKLCDQVLRPEVGVVGPMLLYEDGTIQHAGIVVGMGGWADHLYKGMLPDHYASPYISPAVTRNVMAVTGACMAISKKTIEAIGGFDEDFIICGSDVEMCIRAYNHGLRNLYHAGVKLYHLESKSRDSYIPEIDFKKSYECYSMCREYGDPYYNVNLDMNSVQPKEEDQVNWEKIKMHLKSNHFTSKIYEDIKKKIILPSVEQQATVAEIQEINSRKIKLSDDEVRINILIPSVDEKHVFGGISTALDFFRKLTQTVNCMKRIIVTDAPVIKESMIDLPDYHIVDAMEDDTEDYQIVPIADRAGKTLAVSEKDIFIATGWWTAYTIAEVIRWQNKEYTTLKERNPLIYLIQDYEPGFYSWSSRFLMADSTYQLDIPTIAVINSQELKDFLQQKSYHFYRTFTFDPVLNMELKKYLLDYANEQQDRKKQVLVYGRPSVERNAFAVIVLALKRWVELQDNIDEWEILSAGEAFEDIDLGYNMKLHSIGKVSLAEYAKVMSETKVAISLMVSPHPSYPPLEMSTFGIKVITNVYANKNLNGFNKNMIALSNCSAEAIAQKMLELCAAADGKCQLDSDYVKNADSVQMEKVVKEIADIL